MAAALLSCLGVSGWGPLHWLLWEGGEPVAVQKRLLRAWWLERQRGEGDPPAAVVLASLLRRQGDLMPVSDPATGERLVLLRYRHRLVCAPGERVLRLRSWEWRAKARPWPVCGAELRLDASGPTAPSPGASASLTAESASGRAGRSDRSRIRAQKSRWDIAATSTATWRSARGSGDWP